MIDAGAVAGYVIAWVGRRTRRDESSTDATDVTLEKLYEVVAAKLRGDPALAEAEDEAADDTGHVDELTRQRVQLSLIAAARKDSSFADAVRALVNDLRRGERQTDAGARVFQGDAQVRADAGGIAFGQVAGDVTVDRAGRLADPSGPGR